MVEATVHPREDEAGQWRDLRALDDDNLWADPWYHRRLLASLAREGFEDAAIDLVRRVLCERRCSDYSEFCIEARDLARSESSEALQMIERVIAHWQACREYNLSVYNPTSVADYKTRYWPNNAKLLATRWDHYVDIYEADIFSETHRFIDRSTAVVSAGSCFAQNISRQLQHWGYNYLIEMGKSKEHFTDPRDYQTDSATCGNIYNVISMRQMVERAFLEWEPQQFLISKKTKKLDPFRAVLDFEDYDTYVARQTEFKYALNRALTKCDAFILTLGMTEAWIFADTGEATSTGPRRAEPTLVRHKNISVAETLAELERIHVLFAKHNPKAKIIATVSPVPLNATFKTEEHVVVANCLSKSTLRVALDEFAKRHPENVFYFPAYEIVVSCTRDPWEVDMRHVSNAAVDRVMQQFQKMFLVDQAPLPTIQVATIPEFIAMKRNYPLKVVREHLVWPLKRALGIEGRSFRSMFRRG
jgi:hypothetical protein